jgi:hypothetical protein
LKELEAAMHGLWSHKSFWFHGLRSRYYEFEYGSENIELDWIEEKLNNHNEKRMKKREINSGTKDSGSIKLKL